MFEGNYKNGKKEGHGSFIWANGNKYSGNIENNLINGEGTFSWSDGRKF